MIDLNYKYLKNLGFIDYTYENMDGGSGLITYQHISVKLKQEIIKLWTTQFIDKENNIIIQGPVLTPKIILANSGHLNNMAYELFNITQSIYLRPETCQTIFSYYSSTFGKVIQEIGIGQIGLSFRNEITSRTNLLRLKEFTQLQLELFSSCQNTSKITINNKVYEISEVLKQYIDKTLQFFNTLGLKTELIWKTDKPHYSKATIDFMFNDVEIASLNDRGNFDLPLVKTNIYEVSIGLDRVFLCILFNLLKHDLFCNYLRPQIGVVYDCEYTKIADLLDLVKPYASYKYIKTYKSSVNSLQKLKCTFVLIINKDKSPELKVIDPTKHIKEWITKVVDLDLILSNITKSKLNLTDFLFF